MDDLVREIMAMTGQEAVACLGCLAEKLAPDQAGGVQWEEGFRPALRQEFGAEAAGTEAGEGEVAWAALALAAVDPESRPLVEDCLREVAGAPAVKSFSFVGGVAVLAAALVILQTRVRFKRTSSGEWEIEVEKNAAGDDLLKEFVKKVTSFWPK